MTETTTEIVKYEYQGRMPVRNAQNVKAMLTHFQADLEEALPEGSPVNFKLLVAAGVQAVLDNPKLGMCSQQSIVRAVMTSARFGLDCSGKMNSAHLVPFKGTCQLIIGYGGLLDLARRAAKTVNVDCQLVYEGDIFQMVQGTDPTLMHEANASSERQPKDIIGCYAVATFKEGGRQQIEYMTVQEVLRIRAQSRSPKGGPWETNFGEMCRKTVIRRIVKYLPVSVVEAGRLLAEAVDHDVQTSGFETHKLETSDAARTQEIKGLLGKAPPPVEYAEDGEPIPEDVGRQSDGE